MVCASIQVNMRYSDWREVDGVKLPFKITQSMPNLKLVFTVTAGKHNLSLDDTSRSWKSGLACCLEFSQINAFYELLEAES